MLDYQHALMAVINLWATFFKKIEKFRKKNKNLSSQIFFVGNNVNDPLKAWSIY